MVRSKNIGAICPVCLLKTRLKPNIQSGRQSSRIPNIRIREANRLDRWDNMTEGSRRNNSRISQEFAVDVVLRVRGLIKTTNVQLVTRSAGTVIVKDILSVHVSRSGVYMISL